MQKEVIEIEDSNVSECSVAECSDGHPCILLQVDVPVGYGGTEVALTRNDILKMLDSLNGVW